MFILVLSIPALCLSRSKLPFTVSWLKTRSLLRGGGTAYQRRSQVLSFSSTLSHHSFKRSLQASPQNLCKAQHTGVHGPQHSSYSGKAYILHKTSAQHRGKKPTFVGAGSLHSSILGSQSALLQCLKGSAPG